MKSKISLAPNNDAAWNYLRGILNHTHTPFSQLHDFLIPYTVPHDITSSSAMVLDLENPLPSPGADLPCPAALEFLAEIYEEEGHEDGTANAVLVRPRLFYINASPFSCALCRVRSCTGSSLMSKIRCAKRKTLAPLFDPTEADCVRYWEHRAREALKLTTPSA